MKNKFYVTTPIYYVTAKPHLGSLYSTLLADVAARWHKLQGINTFFLTGTDEHGQKIAQAAAHAGKSPQEFVDGFVDAYKDMWHKYDIEYSHFVRTTDPGHVKAVQQWIRSLIASGDIYKGHYTGYYCTPCETYVTGVEGEEPPCDSCGRPTQEIAEESYFFKLSAYQDRLLELYENQKDFVIPSERLNEVISFVKGGLRDLSISRTTVKWGIPFPDDEDHTVYVWADALNNYLTAIGYGNEARQEEFAALWPADLQIMGKDIVRFHAVYWPAFLMASGLPLPEHLLVHGWIKINAQKMSKSLGNTVDPQLLLDEYGADTVRYYLTRYMAITQDSEFSTQDLERRINSDLANDLGNLLNRVIALAKKRDMYEITAPENWNPKSLELRDQFWTTLEKYSTSMEGAYYSRALATLFKYIHEVNAYFHASEPWKLKDAQEFEEVISAACHSLYGIAMLLQPVMPNKMEQLLKSLGVVFELGVNHLEELDNNPWKRTFLLHAQDPLFKKYELKKEEQPKEKKSSMPEIVIDDVAKVYQCIGTIEKAEQIEGSDKLLKLQVNFGPLGMKQVLSGIKKYFLPEDIVGLQAVFIVNLKPRKMMGLESQGMILTVSDNDKKLKLVTVENVPNGTRLK